MPKKTKIKCKVCGEIKDVVFEGNDIQYPIFSCPNHGPDKTNAWLNWKDKYSLLWKDKDAWERPRDKVSCLVGYFCHQFKEFYEYPYSFDVSSPIPFQTKDFVVARKILAMFNGDAKEARVYVKWMFAKKMKQRKKALTGMGFFAIANYVNEFKYAKKQSAILKRYTYLPKEFINWCQSNYREIFLRQELATWNDLNGLVTFIKSYGEDNIEGKIVNEAVRQGLLKSKYNFVKLEG